jgi:hypothetical protein
MGGRMGGESPRVKKAAVHNWNAGAVRLYQAEDVGKAAAATASAAGQASEQQSAV